MTISTTCGVTVQTWGTRDGAGSMDVLGSILFGGNSGHASIILTIPVNAETEILVKEYCESNDENVIPHQRKKIQFSDGNIEEVYEIRFSWWALDEERTYLSKNPIEDQMDTRRGVDFSWSEEATTLFHPKSRLYTGGVGSSSKRLGPLSVVHTRNLKYHNRILQLEAENVHIFEINQSLQLIIKKFNYKSQEFSRKLSQSEILLLTNTLPEIKDQYDFGEIFTTENLSDITALASMQMKNNEILVENNKSTIIDSKKIIQYRATQNIERLQKTKKDLQTSLHRLQNVLVHFNDKLDYGVNMQESDADQVNHINTLNEFVKEWVDYVEMPEWMIVPKEMKNLINVLQKNIDSQMIQISEVDAELQQLNYIIASLHNFEHYLTLGTPPDNIVYLPIKKIPGSNIGFDNGLDTEKMLKHMHMLVTSNYSIFDRNCADTVSEILEAGAPEAHLKAAAANRAWGALGTPQMVYNAAVRIQAGIYKQEHSNIWHSIEDFNPIERAEGALLRVLIYGNTSKIRTAFYVFLLIFVSVAAIGAAFIRSCFNPLGAVKTASGLMSYIYTKNYIPLKIVGTVILVPIMLLFAIPAAVQIAITTIIINPIKKIATWFSRKAPEFDLIDTASSNDQQAQAKIKDNDFSKYINSKIIVINGLKPIDALANFIKELEASDESIPILSKESLAAINVFALTNPQIPRELQDLIASLPGMFASENISSFKNVANALHNISLQRVHEITAEYRIKNKNNARITRKEKMIFSQQSPDSSNENNNIDRTKHKP